MLSPHLSKPALKAFLAVGATVLVLGCAPSVHKKGLEDMRLTGDLVQQVRKDGKVDLSGEDGVICRQEMPTGSHLAIWRCDTLAGSDKRARDSQREVLKSQSGPKPKIGN